MTKKQIPENAIDKFFYKIGHSIGHSFINTVKTIKESKTIQMVIVLPIKNFFIPLIYAILFVAILYTFFLITPDTLWPKITIILAYGIYPFVISIVYPYIITDKQKLHRTLKITWLPFILLSILTWVIACISLRPTPQHPQITTSSLIQPQKTAKKTHNHKKNNPHKKIELSNKLQAFVDQTLQSTHSQKANMQCHIIDNYLSKNPNDLDLKYSIALLAFYYAGTDAIQKYCQQYYLPTKHLNRFKSEFLEEKQKSEQTIINRFGHNAWDCRYPIFIEMALTTIEQDYQLNKRHYSYSRHEYCLFFDEVAEENMLSFNKSLQVLKTMFNQ